MGTQCPQGLRARSAIPGVCRSTKACRLLVHKVAPVGAVVWAGTPRTGRTSPGGGGGRSLGFGSRERRRGCPAGDSLAFRPWRHGLGRRRVRPTPGQLELDPGKTPCSVAQTFRGGVARGSGAVPWRGSGVGPWGVGGGTVGGRGRDCGGRVCGGGVAWWPSPVIRVLAQRRLIRVVGGSGGREARMRRSRRILRVEAVL